ncbi:F-box/kelch-repeat protein At3g23880-like [Rutidosis leptorrhynchoides]|uniref:F-box/kelch-repeat protein At3g23880-like n=1 Tax=Rutidosis leptorrhynchoides TaxID=125765 RepID=UPI003A99E592
MSNHIPFEIQIEILKKLPVKSVMRFRSVSKPWKSLIDSSRFVSDYNQRQTQPLLLITYEDPCKDGLKYLSVVDDDDDNLSKQMCDMSPFLSNSAKEMIQPTLVSSSQGLLCLYDDNFSKQMCYRAIIWNPWIRKSVTVTFPNFDYHNYGCVVGFGVCPKTSDPKLVKVTFPESFSSMEPWKIEVYSLSSGFWRSRSFSKISDVPCESLNFAPPSECVDGFIYWIAYCKDVSKLYWVIISFDLTNEEFGVIYLPDFLKCCYILGLSKHRESLVLLPHDYTSGYDSGVWMMEGGVTKTFRKLFTINSTDDGVNRMAISDKGEAILEMVESYRKENVASIGTYEYSSDSFNRTRITQICGFAFMSSYMETMLLHDY